MNSEDSITCIYESLTDIEVDVRDLYNFLQLRGNEGVFLKTHDGVPGTVSTNSPILDSIKKENVECVEIEFRGHKRKVASTHRFMDPNGDEVFAKDAWGVQTIDGPIEVFSKKDIGNHDVYDFSIAAPHWYHDQYGVIHHNTGKTLGLIDFSAGYIRDGKNVLYISMEMREEMIMQRVDANMLKVPINSITSIGKDQFITRINTLREKSYGKLKVKEFPPGMASAVHIRHVVDELKLKQNFFPDVIVVDYLQIAASSRIKYGQMGSYYYYKSVAEELRALAVELDVVMWTAAQFNRGGMNSTEVGMEDIAESTGIAMSADGMWGLMRTDELDAVGQIMWKQLKSRYANKAVRTRFVTGVNVEQNRFMDVEQNAQPELSQPEQVVQMTGKQLKERFMGLQ